MRRKGVMHTVEAVLAAILFMFFVLTMMPQTGPGTGGSDDVDRRALNTLKVLDLNGSLREPATERNLTEVKDRVDDHMRDRSVEVSGLFLNTTSGRNTFSSPHTDSFRVNQSTAERQVLRVWYENAESPNVSVEGTEVAALTGTVDDYREYDISGETSNGANTLTIDVASTSTVGYIVDIYEREETAEPPGDTDVLTTSYVVSGDNATFKPVEVSVLSWR